MSAGMSVVVTNGGGGVVAGGPPPFGFSIAANDVVKAEGNAGSTEYTFTVTRFGDLSTAGSIAWTILNSSSTGTATNVTNAADFTGARSGMLDFAAGQVSQIITITVAGDTTAETDELFSVALSNQASFTSAPLPPDWADRVTATILNDDAAVSATYSLGFGSGGSLGPLGIAEQAGGTDFIITRSGDISVAGSVDWQVAGRGASPATGADFAGGVLPGGTVQFAAGEITKTVHLAILNDYAQEPTEGFQILLSNPPAGTGLDIGQMDGNIFDDDAAAGFAVVANAASVIEGQPGTVTPYTFTVYRSGDTAGTTSVDWSVGSGFVLGKGSANPFDFAGGTYPAGTVIFTPGQSSQIVTVLIQGDRGYEPDVAFAVNLTNPSAGMALRVASANGIILNDDPLVPPTVFSVSATDANKAEGNSGSTPFTFAITRAGDVTNADFVTWGTWPGNVPYDLAVHADDFFGGGGPYLQGTANFAPGEITRTVTINVAGDLLPEPNESFAFYLIGSSVGTMVAPNAADAIAHILDDDAPAQPGTFSIATNDASKPEGDAGTTDFTFTVSRTGDLAAAASIIWSVTLPNYTGSPLGPGIAFLSDFPQGALLYPLNVPPAGTVLFAAGEATQTITIQVSGDTTYEPDETFTVSLFNPSYGSSIATGSAIGTILNDDAYPIDYTGTTGNDTVSFAGNTSDKILDLSQGGNDTATGGDGDDRFLLAASFTASEKINGGAGADTLNLHGDYSGGVTLGSTTLTNVEWIVLDAGNSYKLITNDATISAGATLTIDALALASVNSATINGAAEKNGNFSFLGGAGNDAFTGGRGADNFRGGLGADNLTGGLGADVFRYGAVADSALLTSGGTIDVSGADTLVGFIAGTDKIDLSGFVVPSVAASVLTKTTTAFSSTLANGAGFFGTAGVAVEYAKSGKATNARVYADTNHDGNLNAGDMLIQITGVTKNSIGASSFIF